MVDPDASGFAAIVARAERQHGLVTVDDLAAGSISHRQIARWTDSGRLVAVERGVYRVGGSPPTTQSRVLAAVLVQGEGTWASHRTAAWVWDLQGFSAPGRIEIVRLAPLSNERTAARVHRTTSMPEHHHAVVAAIPVTSMSRTLFDLAGWLPAKPLGRAVEAALRTRHCSIGSLYRVLEELGGRGRRGTRAMRAILAERGRTYVPTESELDLLGRAVLAPVDGIGWQVPISDERGYIRRVDGVHRSAGVVIEWDGAAFHQGAQKALDDDGDRRLRALGLAVLRYGWDDVTLHPARVVREVVHLVQDRTASAA